MTTQPHTCPVCMGTGRVQSPQPSTATDTTTCPACKGACVLWAPPPAIGEFTCGDNSVEKTVQRLIADRGDGGAPGDPLTTTYDGAG